MNKQKVLIAGACILFLAVTLKAQIKIGVIDANRAVLSTDEGKAEIQKFQEWAKKQQEQLIDLGKQLKDKQDQYQNQQNVLAEDKRAELLKEIEDLDTRAKRKNDDNNKEAQRRLDEFRLAMDKKISPLFKKYAEDNKFSLIFYFNPADQEPKIAYFEPAVDVTDEIIKIYNQTYPYTSAKPAEAKPAAPAKPPSK